MVTDLMDEVEGMDEAWEYDPLGLEHGECSYS